MPDDVELARTLRKTAKPVTLAVNKIDVPAHAARVGEFHGLGFERTRGISAEHGRGAWDALEELVALLPAAAESEGELAPGIRIAVVGRPNVGKSSLVNRLLGEQRVVVSDEPGTTRDAIDAVLERDGERYMLVDTAGLRRPGRRSETTEHVSALMTVRALERADVALCSSMLKRAYGSGRAGGAAHARSRLSRRSCSRTNGIGCAAPRARNRCAKTSLTGCGSWTTRPCSRSPRIPVRASTRCSSACAGCTRPRVARSAPPSSIAGSRTRCAGTSPRWRSAGRARRPLKFFYATQTGQRPPTFTLFCSEPSAVQPAYRRFLENRLRDAFDFAGDTGADPAARALGALRGALSARWRARIQSAPVRRREGRWLTKSTARLRRCSASSSPPPTG